MKMSSRMGKAIVSLVTPFTMAAIKVLKFECIQAGLLNGFVSGFARGLSLRGIGVQVGPETGDTDAQCQTGKQEDRSKQ